MDVFNNKRMDKPSYGDATAASLNQVSNVGIWSIFNLCDPWTVGHN